jgi:hypothetical protein
MEEDSARRLILSWENFMSYPLWSLKDTLYPNAAERVRAFSNIFPDIQAEFCLAIRNPVTFLPGLFQRQATDKTRAKSHEGFLEGTDIFSLRWSQTLQSILDVNPGVPLTVWCDEDTPLIWPEVLQIITQHDPATTLEDTDLLLASLMTTEGMSRLRAYLESHPTVSPALRRKVISAFLDKFVQPEKVTQPIFMPGWTEDTVARMTETYERDVVTIAKMPGVRLISA